MPHVPGDLHGTGAIEHRSRIGVMRGAMVHGTTRHDDVTAANTTGWPERRVSPNAELCRDVIDRRLGDSDAWTMVVAVPTM